MRLWPRRQFMAGAAVVASSVKGASRAAEVDVPPIAAAADLKFALDEVAAQFKAETGREVKITYGSSGNFVRQLQQGAPFQVFLSADEGFVFQLAEAAKATDQGVPYAEGRVVLFAPHGSSLKADANFELERLNHTKWACKHHVVFIPKCRRKTLYMQLRQYLGEVFRRLAEQKERRIEEGHLMSDHVHMMISIPPKYAVSQGVGCIKGKSVTHLARTYGEQRRNFVGRSFWARGYFVSTVGRDEEGIRNYIRKQEQED